MVLVIINDACTLALGTGCADYTYYMTQWNHYILHVSTIQQFVLFIYGMMVVLSCQIQHDFSLYYNMVTTNGKNMVPNAREKTMEFQGKIGISTQVTDKGMVTQSL